MAVNKELMKGSTAMLVMSVLSKKDLYGYQIVKTLEEESKNVFSLKEGTLYPILHTLEKDGLLTAYWEESEQGRKRKYYHLTEQGRKMLSEQAEEWKIYANAVSAVVFAGV